MPEVIYFIWMFVEEHFARNHACVMFICTFDQFFEPFLFCKRIIIKQHKILCVCFAQDSFKNTVMSAGKSLVARILDKTYIFSVAIPFGELDTVSFYRIIVCKIYLKVLECLVSYRLHRLYGVFSAVPVQYYYWDFQNWQSISLISAKIHKISAPLRYRIYEDLFFRSFVNLVLFCKNCRTFCNFHSERQSFFILLAQIH